MQLWYPAANSFFLRYYIVNLDTNCAATYMSSHMISKLYHDQVMWLYAAAQLRYKRCCVHAIFDIFNENLSNDEVVEEEIMFFQLFVPRF